MAVTIVCRDTINCKDTIVLCNGAQECVSQRVYKIMLINSWKSLVSGRLMSDSPLLPYERLHTCDSFIYMMNTTFYETPVRSTTGHWGNLLITIGLP